MSVLGKLIVRIFLVPAQKMRASQFDLLPRPQAHVVFLGDSITEHGNWNEWFPATPLVNRGISGDTTAGVLARLDTAIDNPLAVFLLIGTNDLAFGVKQAAIQGRTNMAWFNVDREDTFYGQCSELCGQNHGFMPIEIRAVSREEFNRWVLAQGGHLPVAAGAPNAAAPAAPTAPGGTPAPAGSPTR